MKSNKGSFRELTAAHENQAAMVLGPFSKIDCQRHAYAEDDQVAPKNDRNDAAFFRWSTVISNRIMTIDTMKPDTIMNAVSAAPNSRVRGARRPCSTRTKADCATNSTTYAEKAAA